MKKKIILNSYFWVFASISIVLLIVSFFLPPQGEIHPSVLQGVAELFGFSALGAVYKGMDKGLDARVKHRNTELLIGDITSNNQETDTETDEQVL